jgi:hypothetical protein
MATTVQFAGTKTFWYLAVAEASSTLVSPSAFNLSSAIFAFCPIKSGIVMDAAAAGAGAAYVFEGSALGTSDGALVAHTLVLGAGWVWVIVTVGGGVDVVPPSQATTADATAETSAANILSFPFTVAEPNAANRISKHCAEPLQALSSPDLLRLN